MRTTINTSFVLSLALAACGDNLEPPVDEPTPVARRTITGSQIVHYRTLAGSELGQRPVDLWDTVIEAHVADGDGWTVHPGVGHRDGSFAIADVPEGGAWLRVARRPYGDTFMWTDADHVSFDESVLGPEQPTSANDGDRLELAIDGLAPWQEGDELAWFVPEDNVYDQNLIDERPPASEATELTTDVDWTGRALATVAPGEPAFVVQYRTKDLGEGLMLRTAVRGAAVPAIWQEPGAITSLDATLGDLDGLPYRLAWDRAAFEAQRTVIHPTRVGASYHHGFSIFASSTFIDGDMWIGSEYPVAFPTDAASLHGTTPLDLGTITIPTAFPRSWLAELYVVSFPVDFPLPDGSPATLEAVIGARSTDVTRSTPVTPTVTPIREVQLDGRDATTSLGGVGLAPTLTWSAPATGSPTSHRIQVIEAVTSPPEPYRPGWYIAAELVVPGDVTSIRLPADVLREGGTYGLVVRTFAQPGADVRREPFRQRASAAFADTVLGPFSP